MSENVRECPVSAERLNGPRSQVKRRPALRPRQSQLRGWGSDIGFAGVSAQTLGIAMSFSITTTRTFAAAHQLTLYDGSLEPLHGHNWRAGVTVSAQQLDGIGVVIDFHELERVIDGVIGPMHNRHLNDVDAFRSMNPSAENVALVIGRFVANALPRGVSLVRVDVWETDSNCATYQP